jgi:hypothetical protein
MFDRTYKTVASLLLGFACLGGPAVCRASIPVKLTGAISGRVANPAGVPQMGATVLLFDRQDRVREKALTDNRGEFTFLGLLPDLYSVRVTLAAFLPAMRRDILVQPGMRSLLAVNLNTIFSSIQIAYPPLENGSFMSDDWKWMLRGSSSTRPVLRFAGQEMARARRESRGTLFSETRGVVRLSAGDGAPATGIANEADMGTAFALATSLYGNNQLEVSGNLGYGSQTGVPVAAFRTSYTRAGGGPKVSVTMRQLYVPGRGGAAAAGMEAPMPMLRSVAASYDDRTQISDHLAMQYGFTVDSVTFLEHVNYFSPYARLSYSMEDGGEVAFAYTSGNARPDLAGASAPDAELQSGLNSLGMIPRMSLRGGRAKIQRGEEYELSYKRQMGSRVYEASAYREAVLNTALSMVSPDGMFGARDVLPDLFSGNSTFNAGDYRSTGYHASVTQNLGESVSATLMFGSMGALAANSREIVTNSPDELRSMIRRGRKRAATARIAATVPWTGTHMIASYQWSDGRWAMPGHLYTTQSLRPMPGLNIYVRQPVPLLSSRPCRVEVTADLRNMLAEGYLPLSAPNGQRILLVETPRSVRGGLNLIF